MSYPKTKSSNSPDKEQTLKTENTQTSTRKKCGVKKNYKQNIDLRIIKMHIFQLFQSQKIKQFHQRNFCLLLTLKHFTLSNLMMPLNFVVFLCIPHAYMQQRNKMNQMRSCSQYEYTTQLNFYDSTFEYSLFFILFSSKKLIFSASLFIECNKIN